MKLQRTFAVLNQLQSHADGVTLKALADRFGVSKNTIQRDLDQLSIAGVPIGERREGQRISYVLEGRAGTVAAFGPEDLRALQAARAALLPYKRSSVFKAFEAALSKLETQHQGDFAQAFEGPLWTGAKESAPSILHTLLTGIFERRRCRIRYTPRGKKVAKAYVIEPHAFLLWNGVTYLRGCVPPYSDMIPFVAHLISEAALLPETFERKSVERTGFGVFQSQKTEDVEVRFDGEVAPYLREKRWHPSQRLEDQEDGGVVFRARLSGRDEFIGWVMSWGEHAQLSAPAAWRDELVRRAQGLLAAHGA